MSKSGSSSSVYYDISENDELRDSNGDESRGGSNDEESNDCDKIDDLQRAIDQDDDIHGDDEMDLPSNSKSASDVEENLPTNGNEMKKCINGQVATVPEVSVEDSSVTEVDQVENNVTYESDTDKDCEKVIGPEENDSEHHQDQPALLDNDDIKSNGANQVDVKVDISADFVQIATNKGNVPTVAPIKQSRSVAGFMDIIRNRANDALAYANAKVNELTSKTFSKFVISVYLYVL